MTQISSSTPRPSCSARFAFSGRTFPHNWTSDSGNAEVEFVVQGESNVFPIEAKAGINTKAKSLKAYRDLCAPPYAIRTSLAPHADGAQTKDIPLDAFGSQLPALLGA